MKSDSKITFRKLNYTLLPYISAYTHHIEIWHSLEYMCAFIWPKAITTNLSSNLRLFIVYLCPIKTFHSLEKHHLKTSVQAITAVCIFSQHFIKVTIALPPTLGCEHLFTAFNSSLPNTCLKTYPCIKEKK